MLIYKSKRLLEYYRVLFLARVLLVIAGHYRTPTSLTRLSKLSLLPDFAILNTKNKLLKKINNVLKFYTMRANLRELFMGTPEFAVPPLEKLVQEHRPPVAVYTQPDKPGGRGRSLIMSPVKMAALRLVLPVVQPDSLKESEAVAQLAGFQPDVIVVAAYGQILPKPVLDLPRYGCLNIHPSLLPRHRGASPVSAAILAGDADTGVSIMLMDSGLDTGPVLAQEKAAISPQDTTGSLSARLSEMAAQMLPAVLDRWVKGEITPRPQNEAEVT